MTIIVNRRAAPRGGPEIRAASIRDQVLAALAQGSRTTLQLAADLDVSRQVAYRALLSLQDSGHVTSVKELTTIVTGTPGRIWTRKDLPTRAARDPLVAALFGSPP